MEEAHLQLIFGNSHSAIEKYSKLIEAEPKSTDLLLCRAIAYIGAANYDSAIKDLERVIELNPTIYQGHFRLGTSLFYKNRFEDAMNSFKAALLLVKEDCDKLALTAWMQKCLREQGKPGGIAINAEVSVKPAVEESKTSEKKLHYDWYQSTNFVCMTFNIKGLKKEKCKVLIEEDELSLGIDLEEGKTFENIYNLNGKIVPAQSHYTILDTKIEISLKKKEEGAQWATLEKEEATPEKRPEYPTSAKKKINWDKLDKDIEREAAKEKPEGDEAMNTLLKAIYEKGDEETRRAMIKSMQTSGGTVLSTNWKEVREKDYEGKDRPEPPKGQQWKKPET